MFVDFKEKTPVLFWIVGVLFLLWGLIGCGFYLTEVTLSDSAYADAFGEDLAAVRGVYPIWAMSAYAMAVWSGLLASILFLLRKRLSVGIFTVSLVAAIIGFIPSFTNSVLRDAAGAGFWVMPLIVVVIGLFEVIYSRKQRTVSILR